MIRMTIVAVLYCTSLLSAEFAEPVMVMVAGKPLDVERRGNAAPLLADFDGDGIKDLLVGEYGSPERSQLRIYRNVGSNASPEFVGFEKFRDGLVRFRKTTFRPHLVDIDGDGPQDVVTVNWPSQISWFRGEKDGFAPAEPLKDKDGDPIHMGWTNSAFPVDWDNDGDLDLVAISGYVGRAKGKVVLLDRLDVDELRFGDPRPILANNEPIVFGDGHADLAVVDWDGDDDRDLVVGLGDGSVIWFSNSGNNDNPKFEKFEELVKPPGRNDARGKAARICVVDWNDDGKLDLLIGDKGNRFKKTLSADEEKQRELATQRQAEAFKEWSKHFQIYRSLHNKKKAAPQLKRRFLDNAKKGMREAKHAINMNFEEEVSIKPGNQTHGHVWVLLRK